MVKEILLPDLGEGIDGADVSEVVVSVGDTVSKDDTLLVLESDKASMEIPAEDAGTIKEILVSPGDSLETGALLMKVGVKTLSSETSLEEELGVAKQEVHQENFETTKQELVQEFQGWYKSNGFAGTGPKRNEIFDRLDSMFGKYKTSKPVGWANIKIVYEEDEEEEVACELRG